MFCEPFELLLGARLLVIRHPFAQEFLVISEHAIDLPGQLVGHGADGFGCPRRARYIYRMNMGACVRRKRPVPHNFGTGIT